MEEKVTLKLIRRKKTLKSIYVYKAKNNFQEVTVILRFPQKNWEMEENNIRLDKLEGVGKGNRAKVIF